MTRSSCPFCHMLFATAEADTVSHDGVRAHRHCVVSNRRDLAAICRQASVFFGSLALPEVQYTWATRLTGGRIFNRETLIAAIRSCLKAIDRWRRQYGAEGQFTYPHSAYVDDFRTVMSKRLVCDL